jgi:hypothetical protein
LYVVTCSGSSANIQAGSQVWAMGGAGSELSGGNGTNSITWSYSIELPDTYTVTFSVTGLDGTTQASDTTNVTVPGA